MLLRMRGCRLDSSCQRRVIARRRQSTCRAGKHLGHEVQRILLMHVAPSSLPAGELTVRQTLEFSARVQGGRRGEQGRV